MRVFYKVRLEHTVVRGYLLKEFSGIDVKLLDDIIAEIYNLQGTYS